MLNRTKSSNAPLSADGEIELSQIIRYEIEHIWVTPICEFFGIDIQNQQKVIYNDPILSSKYEKKHNYLMFGDNRKRVLLSKNAFLRWVQLINPKIVRPELREKFIQFQHRCIDYLYGNTENQATHAELYKEYLSLVQQRAAVNSRLKAVKKELDQAIEQRMLGTTVSSGQHSLPL